MPETYKFTVRVDPETADRFREFAQGYDDQAEALEDLLRIASHNSKMQRRSFAWDG